MQFDPVAVRRSSFLVLVLSLVFGCAQRLTPAPRSGEPIGVQLMRAEPMFVGAPFRVLLDFELADDLAFIGNCPSARIDSSMAHTGRSCLQLPSSAGHFSVRLGHLLDQGPFPGSWTLLGGYFYSHESCTIEISYETGGQTVIKRSVTLRAHRWTPVLLDITSLNDPNRSAAAPVGTLNLALPRQTVWCDDVLVLDNTHFIIGDAEQPGDNWIVCRRGYAITVDRPGSFKFSIPTSETGPDGWNIQESSAMRVILTSADQKHTWTIYRDGTEYLNGKFQCVVPLSADQTAQMIQQQAHPAELKIPEELGRLDRDTRGDLNNDGYAELYGAYEVKTNGPRIQITITPQISALCKPVIEIAGLPLGRVVAALDGQLIDQTVRLPNGHVLIQIGSTIQKPVTLDVRVP